MNDELRAHIESVQLHGENSVYVLTEDSDALPASGSGSNYGRLLVELVVDDTDGLMVTTDLAQTGTLAALDYAVEHLTILRDRYAELFGDRDRPGRCMVPGEWGRCTGDHGHIEHMFPTEEQGMRDLQVLTAARQGGAR